MLLDGVHQKCLQRQPNLTYDEACLDINNMLSTSVNVSYQYDECYKCNFQNLATLAPNKSTSVLIKTSSQIQLAYTNCHYHQYFYEHYRFGLNITKDCSPIYVKEPADDAYLPILMAFIILFAFGTVWYMIKCIYKNSGRVRQLLIWNTEMEEDLIGSSTGAPIVFERPPTALPKHPNRLKSIDTFRGLCIAIMIFVNYGGGKYSFFIHSVWNGLTIADLVFPWFIWLMGFSITISMQQKARTLVPRRLMIFQVIRRSCILILIGIVLNSNKNMSTIAELRFPGVLQRIGLVYCVVGMIEIAFIKRLQIGSVSWVSDLKASWPQWVIVSILIGIHTCLTFLTKVHNCDRGYLGPGGLEDGGKNYNCTGGFAGYIDRLVFGQHMYQNIQTQIVYENKLRFDPEGIFGTFTAILTAYFGVQAGKILSYYEGVKGKLIRWLIWGFVSAIIGGILCRFSTNDGPIPLNKKLWSLSYTFLTAGLAFIIESGLYLFVDVLKKWGGRPLFYPGMNAIILYIGHELFKNTFPFGWIPIYQMHSTYLFMNLWGTFLWVSISIWMYKHNIFFKI